MGYASIKYLVSGIDTPRLEAEEELRLCLRVMRLRAPSSRASPGVTDCSNILLESLAFDRKPAMCQLSEIVQGLPATTRDRARREASAWTPRQQSEFLRSLFSSLFSPLASVPADVASERRDFRRSPSLARRAFWLS